MPNIFSTIKAPELPSNLLADPKLRADTMQKIFAYLGELGRFEYAPVMQIAADLDLSYGTCAEYCKHAVEVGMLAHAKTASKSNVRLNDDIDPKIFAELVPEWDDSLGTHPTDGRRRKYFQRAE